jgi:hypothetical protein
MAEGACAPAWLLLKLTIENIPINEAVAAPMPDGSAVLILSLVL